MASFPENRLKKGAIAVGVSQAKGDWIACTDGDCRVPAAWLSSINQCRVEQQAKFISGPVAFASDGSWFQQLQALEFSALIGVGAASIGLTLPTMCNGANLAYEKSAFLEVNGFSGNAHLPSGDDEFLMHKIHQREAGCVAFLKDRNATVYTKATNSFTSFIEQRKRWASKWKHYTLAAPKALALLVLVGNISLWLALVATIALGVSWSWFLLLVVLKLVADAFLLYQVLGFFQNRKLLLHLGLLQLVYVPYILATAILGWRGTYAWKDRQHVAA
ncbi:hypothetical protein GCM10023183_09370 [Nibribacter koreensis]|uniref:Glycosyltransferase 2-like domain-containing protein n=1 Tax=Nibribacter koreensis TaxID=1084519 RepID=A0ABP8FBR8_9BACT